MLFGARALQGAFAALMAPAALSILTITFQADPKERAKAFGAYGAVSGAGGAIGVLARRNPHGVRLVAVVPARQRPHRPAGGAGGGADHPREPCRRHHPLRHPGRAPVHRGPGLPGLRLHQGRHGRLGIGPTLILISVAAVLLVAFVRGRIPLEPPVAATAGRGRTQPGRRLSGHPAHRGRPVRHVRLPQLLLPAGAALLGRSKPAWRSCPSRIGIIVAAGASSALVPRVGPRLPMAVGLLVGALGLAWLTQIGVHTSYWTHVLPPEIVTSLGLGLAFPTFSSTALTRVRERDSGVASALVGTTQQVGGSLGTALLNTIAATATANYIAAHGLPFAAAGVVHGFSVALAVGAGFLALAAIVSAVFVKARTSNLPDVAPSPAATASR